MGVKTQQQKDAIKEQEERAKQIEVVQPEEVKPIKKGSLIRTIVIGILTILEAIRQFKGL